MMTADTMTALRVRVAGRVTSFRHPHFLTGVQPSYDVPPPATLYGHISSALGRQPPPDSFRVAVHFTYETRWLDYEHTHLFGDKTAKLSPLERELLFQPRLTLYIDRSDWVMAFRQPRYVVTLGRSQDLMTYVSVDVVTLYKEEAAYIEHGIVPLDDAAPLRHRTAITLPRYIDSARQPFWGMYARVFDAQPFDAPNWIDPDAPRWRNRSRAVVWLDFV